MEKFGKIENKSEKISEERKVLQKTWQEAFDKMYEVSDQKRREEILNLTASTFYDAKLIEEYLKREDKATYEDVIKKLDLRK